MFSFKKYIEKLLLGERSSKKLAASFAVGTFIAITPIIPFQTPLLFLVSWLFKLNAAVVFAAVYLVNNPLTLIPIYLINYAFGVWLFEKVLGWNLIQYNPSWMGTVNNFVSQYIDIKKYLGSDFCLWCLLFGGLIFAALVSIPLYPLLKRFCDRAIAEYEKSKYSK